MNSLLSLYVHNASVGIIHLLQAAFHALYRIICSYI